MTIDDKVVSMSFENSKFESGVRTSISSIDKLKSSLQFTGASQGLSQVSSSLNNMNRTNFRPLNKSIDSVRAHFSALNVIMGAALGHLTIQAVNAGERLAKALTIGPIIQGLDIYQTKLQAIQTILANTGAAGTKMSQVTDALNQLNIYANKTIFSFGEMTKNIGTFTAAGVGLKPAVSAIKGISNLAALSGSNAQQAATAMYQLSQAIGAGRVSLQDWNSVVNAGMGGTVFQRALAQTAVAMGKLKDSSLKLVGPMKNVSINGESFRQSMQAGPGKQSWLTSDVLTKTLATFTGDLTDAQLATIGFNKEQIKSIQATAKTAENAATQVKTFSQLMDVTKETIATGWAQSFELIIGNLKEAKQLFTDISNSLSGMINSSATARNKILTDWKNLGGRDALIQGFKNSFEALGAILKPVHDAFREIFPRKTGAQLADLTKRFEKFTEKLKPSPATVNNLHRTFAGLFAILDIGKHIVGGIIGVFEKLFGTVHDGTWSFLGITASIGDFFVALDNAIKRGKGLQSFFNGLANVLSVPLKLFVAIGHAVANLFAGFSPGGFSVKMDAATKAAEPFKRVLEIISQGLQGLGPAISNALANMQFEPILQVIRTGLLAALVLMIRKFIGGTTLERTLGLFGNKLGKSFAQNLGGKLIGNLSGAFGSLTGTLKTMQENLKAKTLEEIAISIALLSASLVALSLIKPTRLKSALSSMALAFGELIGAMIVLNKVVSVRGAAKLTLIGGAMILLATAMDILTISVIAMSKLSWNELERGLGAIVVLLGTLSAASIVLSKNAGGMVRSGIAIGIIAVALNVMAVAVKKFGSLDLITLGKGLGAVAASLIIIAAAMRIMPRNMILQSAALIVVATALNILVKAVRQFGAMNLIVIGKGLLGIGGGLVIIAGAMHLMPKNMVLMSAGLLLVATSLGKIVSAVGTMGRMSLRELGKGLIGLAGALTILAAALTAMSETLAGAAALTIAAAGLSLLSSALVSLGRQSWTSIIKSIVALSAGLGVLAGAALLLQPTIPALLGFGAALILIGAGLALSGAGIALIGVGLSAIAVAGPTAIGILIQSLIDLTKAIPEMAKNVVLGLLEIVRELAKTAPKFVKAIIKIIDALTEATIKSAPKIAEAFVVLLQSGLEALAKHAPDIVQAGFDILISLLKGINDNLGEVITMGVTIFVTLVNSLTKNMNRLVSAGFTFIISIVEGITNNLGRVVSAGADIVINFLKGFANDVKKIISAGASIILNFLTGIANNVKKIITAGANVIVNFVTGIGNASSRIITAGATAMIKFINGLTSNMNRISNAGARAIVRFLNGVANTIDKYEPQIIKAGIRIGAAIVTGMVKGMSGLAGNVVHKARDIAGGALHTIGGVLGIGSPSRETFKMGVFLIQGLINGLHKDEKFGKTLNNLSARITEAFSNVQDVNPTITPVLDLSSMTKDASKLNGIINKNPIAKVSLNQASAISAKHVVDNTDQATSSSERPVIKFQQNNFSPRELTPTEVYRQTRNQLSKLRSLAVPAT